MALADGGPPDEALIAEEGVMAKRCGAMDTGRCLRRERRAYYGVRALFVLYMVDEVF
jgi:hypothetical protein